MFGLSLAATRPDYCCRCDAAWSTCSEITIANSLIRPRVIHSQHQRPQRIWRQPPKTEAVVETTLSGCLLSATTRSSGALPRSRSAQVRVFLQVVSTALTGKPMNSSAFQVFVPSHSFRLSVVFHVLCFLDTCAGHHAGGRPHESVAWCVQLYSLCRLPELL